MKTTRLHQEHQALGASFTDFGGWEMPVRYSSDLAEHHAVRQAAGLFDISHMAEIFVSGPDAATFLEYALVGLASEIRLGKAKYSLICETDGGVLDDLVIYRTGETEFLIVANAGNHDTVVRALSERVTHFNVTVNDASDETALLALQGPNAAQILGPLLRPVAASGETLPSFRDLAELKYYSMAQYELFGHLILLGRTGYTGEDGFEIFAPNGAAVEIWRGLLASGEEAGLVPCGLACRDTLRLEAGMPLYGHELNTELNPFMAGLGRVVKLEADRDFVGKAALARLSQHQGRRLVGIRAEGKRAARADYELFGSEASTAPIGVVTSGALSPSLGYPIAMAYVDVTFAELGSRFWVDIRGNRTEFWVVSMPFYARQK